MKIKKWVKIVLIILVILLIAFFVFTYLKKVNENKKTARFNELIIKKAKKYTVSKNSIPDYIEVDDEVEPKEIKNLFFPISGKIEKIYVEEGDNVKKDQLIAKLDTSSIELNILQIEKDIDNAIVNGSSNLDIEILKKQKSIYEQQLEEAYLKAPFSGYIASLDVDENDVISAGHSIGQIYDLSYLISKIWIDETEIRKLKVGNLVEVKFSYNESKKYYGKIDKIYKNFQIVDGVVSYPVEIKFDKLPEEINPGFTFSGKIYYGKKTDKIVIPITSVNKDEKGYYVAKIDNNKIIKTYIKIGDIGEKYYEVVDGLKEGDIILFLNILNYKKLDKFKKGFNPLKRRPPPPSKGK